MKIKHESLGSKKHKKIKLSKITEEQNNLSKD
jgi:hypothetical protein